MQLHLRIDVQTHHRRGALFYLLALCSISDPAEVEDRRTTNAMANLGGRRENVKEVRRGERIVRDRCSTVLEQKIVEIRIANI